MQTRPNIVQFLGPKIKNSRDNLFSSNTLKICDRLTILSGSVVSDPSLNEHICSVAKKSGFLLMSRRFFTPLQLLILYKAQIRLCLEYGSHRRRGAAKHYILLPSWMQLINELHISVQIILGWSWWCFIKKKNKIIRFFLISQYICC